MTKKIRKVRSSGIRKSTKAKRGKKRQIVVNNEEEDSDDDDVSYLDSRAVREYVRNRPIVVQIPGPDLRDYMQGRNHMVNVPENYEVRIKIE